MSTETPTSPGAVPAHDGGLAQPSQIPTPDVRMPADRPSAAYGAHQPVAEPVTDEVLVVGNHRVRVTSQGDGPPLLLLNGIGAPLELWAPLLRRLDGLRAIAFDTPGSGRSIADRALTVEGHARLALRLLDSLQLPVASVLGYSFGGMVGQEMARLAGHRVERLILASTSCGWGGVPGSPSALLSLVDAVASGYLGQLVSDGSRPVVGDMRRRIPPVSRRGYLAQFWAASTWSSCLWLHEITQPTLVVTGDLDDLVPPVNGHILTTLIPHARLEIIRGGGHLALLERADVAAPLIQDFLRT